tara:strand:- start:777 stop:965 length:189 start_codon:yes stop_codon:yes gene_type:complete
MSKSSQTENGQLVLIKPNGQQVILGTAYKDYEHSIPSHWVWNGQVWMNMRLYELVEKEMVIE